MRSRDSNLSICINFTVFSFAMTYNIIKKFVSYFDEILHRVSKTCTFDSPNSIYLKIFGFIRYDFSCFGDEDKPEEFVFLDFKVYKKTVKTVTTI